MSRFVNFQSISLHEQEASGSSVPSILHRMSTKHNPPTYNRTTPMSSAFQGMVDSYGVANYREVNPGLMTLLGSPALGILWIYKMSQIYSSTFHDYHIPVPLWCYVWRFWSWNHSFHLWLVDGFT